MVQLHNLRSRATARADQEADEVAEEPSTAVTACRQRAHIECIADCKQVHRAACCALESIGCVSQGKRHRHDAYPTNSHSAVWRHRVQSPHSPRMRMACHKLAAPPQHGRRTWRLTHLLVGTPCAPGHRRVATTSNIRTAIRRRNTCGHSARAVWPQKLCTILQTALQEPCS